MINRFRGDVSLLTPGLTWLEEKTGKPVLAVLPYLHGLHLDAEDAIQSSQTNHGKFKVIVPVIPRISNHTDFDALRAHPDVDLQFIGLGERIPGADLIILPGSKNTRADLTFLVEQGWQSAIEKHLRYGGKVIGICGGYQMLGQVVSDPHGVEGEPGDTLGLGLLDITTELTAEKRLEQVTGTCLFGQSQATVSGYEIHMGITYASNETLPVFHIQGTDEGARSPDDLILGTYLHGLFDHPDACHALLTWAGLESDLKPDLGMLREQSIDRLADACAPLLAALQNL